MRGLLSETPILFYADDVNITTTKTRDYSRCIYEVSVRSVQLFVVPENLCISLAWVRARKLVFGTDKRRQLDVGVLGHGENRTLFSNATNRAFINLHLVGVYIYGVYTRSTALTFFGTTMTIIVC